MTIEIGFALTILAMIATSAFTVGIIKGSAATKDDLFKTHRELHAAISENYTHVDGRLDDVENRLQAIEADIESH